MDKTELPEHFYLAPSSSYRWLKCPGSLEASAHIEDTAGEAAARGTLGHLLVEIDLVGAPLEAEPRAFLESLPRDVRSQLEDHVDLCVEIVSSLDAHTKLYETKIQSDLLEEHGGTIDVITYDSKTLHVIDFKFGAHKVAIEDNTQIQCYLNLARQMFPDATRFLGSIIQPKISREIQTVEFSNDQLLQHEADVLEASISQHFAAGDHCLWCPVLSTCETAAKHLRDQVDEFPLETFIGGVSDHPTYDQVAQLCKVYKTFKLAERATTGAGPIVKRWARQGANIQAHGLGLRVTHRTGWAPDAADILHEAGVDPAFFLQPQALVTPKQLRETLSLTKGEFESRFQSTLEQKEIHSLIMGKDENQFPEFDSTNDA